MVAVYRWVLLSGNRVHYPMQLLGRNGEYISSKHDEDIEW